MPEILMESVLTGKTDPQLLLRWLNSENMEDTPEDSVLCCCSRSEFIVYFLSYLRNQTESILQTNSNVLPLPLHQNTPEKITTTRRKHRRSTSDPTKDRCDRSNENLSVKTDKQRSHESPSKDKKKLGRKVKTKLFMDDSNSFNQSVSSDESRLSSGLDRLVLSSTPLKNGVKATDYANLSLASPVTPHSRSFNHERCDTPRMGRYSRSQEKSCLGDFMVTAKSSKKKRTDKNVSSDSDKKDSEGKLDLSSSDMFPEIGARKASSLKSDRKRIKPTNLDSSMSQKSFSLNSFNSESFQQTSSLVMEDNLAFQQKKFQPKELSSSFDAMNERNMIKMERHKLMEKFNILSTTSSKPNTPTIKVIPNSSFEKKTNFVKADSNKILFKEKIDLLVDVYDVLIKNNLIMSVNTEIYFLISILLSKQNEDEFLETELKLKDNNITSYLLKHVHNCTYFAVKSLWCQRATLELILDKNSLKILGENKKVRGFFPDLAKFLLNSYGIKSETNSSEKQRCLSESQGASTVVCFNFETDNTDNFPTVLSFQDFKKQRDMFYEIMRWYNETQTPGGSRSTFRARIKTLITCGNNPTNHSHLAALFTKQMILDCQSNSNEESKLSKLQRRLTCPTAQESNRLPHFTAKEIFYKEFITYTENESFRVHLRDAIASKVISLDNIPLVGEDKNSNTSELSKEFLQLSRKLRLLSKFLGFLVSLPYCHITHDVSTKQQTVTNALQNDKQYNAPKEKVLENNIALRNYSQPSIDLKSILDKSIKYNRITITVPWIVHYLSMLDYSSLRIDYYKRIIETLFEIYIDLKNELLKKSTNVYLKSILGWLFDLPHFPQEFFYDFAISTKPTVSTNGVASEVNLDWMVDLSEELTLFDLCPFLKDVNTLLSTCKVSQDKSIASFRHITPVSLGLNPEDRIRNKEKELQQRLEEQFLRSLPSSTRRVLELVSERILQRCLREITSHLLQDSKQAARTKAAENVHNRKGQATLLEETRAIYSEHLEQMRSKALSMATQIIKDRTSLALSALLPNSPPPVLALVVRTCLSRLKKWMQDNWGSTAVLCKNIEGEVKNLQALGLQAILNTKPTTNETYALLDEHFEKNHISIAHTIINLKEQICVLLEGGTIDWSILDSCLYACSANNVFCRQPARMACLQLTVDLSVVYVTRKPKEILELLSKLLPIWDSCCPDRKRAPDNPITAPSTPESRDFNQDDRCPTPISDDEQPKDTTKIRKTDTKVPSRNKNNIRIEIPKMINDSKTSNVLSPLDVSACEVSDSRELLDFFDRILCPRNVVMLNDSLHKAFDVWEAMAAFLVFLLKNDFLTEDSLTEQCLSVYRQDWPQATLENLSNCMKLVSSNWSRSSVGKFTLFLDFLSEYCGEMDIEPVDFS